MGGQSYVRHLDAISSSSAVDATMTISVLSAAAAMFVFAFTMIYAGISDLLTNKIRNGLVLLLLFGYAVLAPLAGFALYELAWSAVVAFGVLLLGFTCFALGWIGGGDAKLAPATALWFGADHTYAYLMDTMLLGGAFALAVLLFRMLPLPVRIQNTCWIARLHSRGTAMPYGVAMALAALLVFPSTRWMTGIS
jgi:prepilin peptidase CpaA